jgi:hypothetical protein
MIELTAVELAEKTLRDLHETKDALTHRIKLLSDQKQKISFAAHTGDKGARAKLNAIIIEAGIHGGELESIEAALQEANQRLVAARAAEALAANRKQALALRDMNAKMTELAQQADDAAWDYISSLLAIKTLNEEMHKLGAERPSSEQVRVNLVIATKSMLQALPSNWVTEFGFSLLLPSQKKTPKAIVAAWHDSIETDIARRLGETKQKEKVA